MTRLELVDILTSMLVAGLTIQFVLAPVLGFEVSILQNIIVTTTLSIVLYCKTKLLVKCMGG